MEKTTEKIMYIKECLSRAGQVHNKLQNILTIKDFERENTNVISASDIRNLYIERNDYINCIVRELNAAGYNIPLLRPWQKDVTVQMNSIVCFFTDLNSKEKDTKTKKAL